MPVATDVRRQGPPNLPADEDDGTQPEQRKGARSSSRHLAPPKVGDLQGPLAA